MENKYRLLKNFTPRDLYEAQAPIELFLTCLDESHGDKDLPFYPYDINPEWDYTFDFTSYEPWFPWLIENKFIGEHEEDIELKPGMILESTEDDFKCQCIVTNNGLYLSKGFIEKVIGNPSEYYKDCKTLQELNNKSGYKWRVLY